MEARQRLHYGPAMTLFVGSDGFRHIDRGGHRPGQQVASHGATVPHGTWHAVRDGERVALCGYEPRYTFAANQWPGTTRDRCAECASLAADRS